ncbi:MAG: DUF4344 domain-containing metallopeptidase [Geminicoccaceae bacterium]
MRTRNCFPRFKIVALTWALQLCQTAPVAGQNNVSEFAQSVTTHVVLHEIGHAVFREFGIPILANEENMADSFATTYITQNMRDDAVDIILARAQSWQYEDSEVEPKDYDHKGEHELDIRRAYQAACLLYGADPAEWGEARAWADFSDSDAADCSDTAPDQIEGWSQVLAPNLLPPGEESENVELIFGEGPLKEHVQASGMMERLAEIARRFDWPKPIILHFDQCDKGSSWNRKARRILLCDDYVMRFIHQGEQIKDQR